MIWTSPIWYTNCSATPNSYNSEIQGGRAISQFFVSGFLFLLLFWQPHHFQHFSYFFPKPRDTQTYLNQSLNYWLMYNQWKWLFWAIIIMLFLTSRVIRCLLDSNVPGLWFMECSSMNTFIGLIHTWSWAIFAQGITSILENIKKYPNWAQDQGRDQNDSKM